MRKGVKIMKNVFKIAAISGCLISFYHGNVSETEDYLIKQQQEILNRVRISEQNCQVYISAQEARGNQKFSRHEKNRQSAKQQTKQKNLKAEEKNLFAMHFLNEKIEGVFKDIMRNGNNPQHCKLIRLIEDIKQEPWALKGEGKPEILKGR
jgi:hypothetical protein